MNCDGMKRSQLLSIFSYEFSVIFIEKEGGSGSLNRIYLFFSVWNLEKPFVVGSLGQIYSLKHSNVHFFFF